MTVSALPARTTDTTRQRPLPRLGGLSTTLLSLEVRRALRNRRVFIFTLVIPVALFLLFGAPQRGRNGAGVPAAAYAMVSFAVYGVMVASTSTGAAVSAERSLGWSRQLRLTPLRPAAYVCAKVASAMILALAAVLVQFGAGAASGVRLPAATWLECGLAAWLGGLVFAAFGLCAGYLLSTENAMQVVGPVLAVLQVFGGLYFPLESAPHTLQTIAHLTPVYGISSIARSPLTGQSVTWVMAANVVVWGLGFAFLAARLFRRDTARV